MSCALLFSLIATQALTSSAAATSTSAPEVLSEAVTEDMRAATSTETVTAVDETETAVNTDKQGEQDEEPDALTKLPEEISIFGRRLQRARIAGSAHRLGEVELERFEYDDIQRFLTKIPGVYVRDEDGFGLRPNIGLRGGSADRSAKITLMEDGVPFAPAPYSAPAAYYFPLTTRMTALEVFKGPSSIRYGPQTIGGAINMVSAPVPVQGVEGMFDLAAGQYGYGKGHARIGYGADRWGVLVEGLRLLSSGFKELPSGADTGFDKNEVMAKLRFNTDPTEATVHDFQLKMSYATETSNETYLGLSDADFEIDPFRRYVASENARMEWQRSGLQLNYTLNADEDFILRVVAYRQDFDRAWNKLNSFGDGRLPYEAVQFPEENQERIEVLRGERDTPEVIDVNDLDSRLLIGTNQRTFFSQGIQAEAELHVATSSLSQTIRVGVRLHNDQIVRHHTEDLFHMRSGALVLAGRPQQEILNNRGSALAFSTHVADEIVLGHSLHVTPGIRMEVISTDFDDRQNDDNDGPDTYVVFLPGVGVYYQLAPAVGVLGGVHRGFSPLAPGQLDDILPESSINYEAGFRLSHSQLRGEVIGFFNQYSNLVAECTVSSGACDNDRIGTQINAGDVNIAGIEAALSADVELAKDIQGTASLSYTITDARFQNKFDSEFGQFRQVDEGDRLPYIPRHQASLGLGVDSTHASLHTNFTFVGQMLDSADQGSIADVNMTDAAFLVDLTATARFSMSNHLYLRIDNLFNHKYIASRRPFGARPGKPFQIQLGYTHRFTAL